jgi:transcriptional regulator of NAD metabolism
MLRCGMVWIIGRKNLLSTEMLRRTTSFSRKILIQNIGLLQAV